MTTDPDIFLHAAKLEFVEHEYSCLHIRAVAGPEQNELVWAYRDLFMHGEGDDGWWDKTPLIGDHYTHQARIYALLLAWAMAVEGDLCLLPL